MIKYPPTLLIAAAVVLGSLSLDLDLDRRLWYVMVLVSGSGDPHNSLVSATFLGDNDGEDCVAATGGLVHGGGTCHAA